MPLGGLQEEQRGGATQTRGGLDERGRERPPLGRLSGAESRGVCILRFPPFFFLRGEGEDRHPAGLTLSSPN